MLFPSECAKDQIMNARFIAPLSLIVFAVAVWVGCSSGVLAPQSSVEPGGADARTTKKTHGHAKPDAMASPTIKHVFVIIQENRSLNDLFMGFAGANTATSGQESDGTVVQLTAVPLRILRT
jgi:phospholipase C